MRYFTPIVAKLDSFFKIHFDDETASSDSDSDNTSGEPSREWSPDTWSGNYLIYESCLYELFKYSFKWENQTS